MKAILNFVVILAAAITIVWADDSHVTPAEQCLGESFDNLEERIKVLPCGKTRCTLRKGTNITVIFKFKPKEKVTTLVSDVSGIIGGIPLPFIGVTGVDACPYVKHTETGESAACPLEADKEYTYTNTFPVHEFYPSVPLVVHWSLDSGDKKVICFEVPAIIAAAKKSRAHT